MAAVPQTGSSGAGFQTEIARSIARRNGRPPRLRPPAAFRGPVVWVAIALSLMSALPIVAPVASAAPLPAGDRARLEVDVEATVETPVAWVTVGLSAEVEVFDVHWDVTGLTLPVTYDLRAVGTFGDRTESCASELSGAVSIGGAMETVGGWSFPSSGQVFVELHAGSGDPSCTVLGHDVLLIYDQNAEFSFETDPSWRDVILDFLSTSSMSLVVLDGSTGTPVAGKTSSSTLQGRTVIEPSEPDKLGRVKVQFHWDRQASSTWIRVAQPYTTGSMFIPRIGFEAVLQDVQFDWDSENRMSSRLSSSEGSPDRLDAEYDSQATEMFAVLAGNLGKLGSDVDAKGQWRGLVIEGDNEVPGQGRFDSSIQLRDSRRPAMFTPVNDHQSHKVDAPANVDGTGLAGPMPVVRFGTSLGAPARSPLPLEVHQRIQFNAAAPGWPRFALTLPAYEDRIRITVPGGLTHVVTLESSVVTTIRGDAIAGHAEAEIRHRMFVIVDRTTLPPITAEFVGVDFVSVPLSPEGQNAPTVHGKINNLKQISLGIAERSNVFAVWTTVGFFQVSEDGFEFRLDGRIELEGNVDPPELPLRVSFNADGGYHTAGKWMDPLFAYYIAEPNFQLDLAAGDTEIEAAGGTRGPLIFGDVDLVDVTGYFEAVVTTPTDRTAVPTDAEAVASVEGLSVLLDFDGMTV